MAKGVILGFHALSHLPIHVLPAHVVGKRMPPWMRRLLDGYIERSFSHLLQPTHGPWRDEVGVDTALWGHISCPVLCLKDNDRNVGFDRHYNGYSSSQICLSSRILSGGRSSAELSSATRSRYSIQLLHTKSRIRDSQEASNALVHDCQNHMPIPVPKTHVHHPVHFLSFRRTQWGIHQQGADRLKSWDCGICSRTDDG
jgi:hypothetical protein